MLAKNKTKVIRRSLVSDLTEQVEQYRKGRNEERTANRKIMERNHDCLS